MKDLSKNFSEENVVGTYESKSDGLTFKLVFLEDGTFEYYLDGKLSVTAFWKLVAKEVHAIPEVYRIETNGDLTTIALIGGGKRREDLALHLQSTFKKKAVNRKKPAKKKAAKKKKKVQAVAKSDPMGLGKNWIKYTEKEKQEARDEAAK